MNEQHRSLQERLVKIVRRFSGRKLMVVGDAIADKFIYGSISRVSREAPVFILRHEQTEMVPGGAANCSMNLASLGASVSLVSVAGNDEAGRTLRDELDEAGVDVSGLVLDDRLQTTTKVRILAGQAHVRQQVIRIDYEGTSCEDMELRQAVVRQLERRVPSADSVVISDYNYGVVDSRAIDVIRKAAVSRDLPVLVDSRFRLSEFCGFTAATPNEEEVERLISKQVVSTDELERTAVGLRQQLGYRALLITRGGQGMMLLEEHELPLHIPAVGAQQPVDGTGAGDTVIATFALALAAQASLPDAARLANYAGGLVVMKRGTATVTAQELEHSILASDIE